MRFRTPEQIRDRFNDLRTHCDPQGHDLLDALENACLVDNALMALQDRVDQLQAEIMGPLGSLGQLIEFLGHSVKVEATS